MVHINFGTYQPLIVKNVLVSTSKVTQKFYPSSINDNYDNSVNDIAETNFSEKVNHGKNVLVGKNVSIGNNCVIGSNTIIRNCLIKNNVRILDNCVIGKHGFGFFPTQNKNLRYMFV